MSNDDFLQTLQDEMGSVLAAVAPEHHAPSLIDVTTGGNRLIRRRRAAWSTGLATLVLAVAAVTVFNPFAPGRAAPVVPGTRSTQASPMGQTGTVQVGAPSPGGSYTQFQVEVTRNPDGSGRIDARTPVGSVGASVDHLVGTVVEASNELTYLAVIPTGAQGPQLLDAGVPEGTAQTGPPTTVPGLPLQVVVFTFANQRDTAPRAVVWFRPDGTPSTSTEVGGATEWSTGGHTVRLWALPRTGWVGGTMDFTDTPRQSSSGSPLTEVRLADLGDDPGQIQALRGYVVQGGIQPGSVTISSPPGSHGLTTHLAPIGDTGLTALFVSVQVPYDSVATTTGTAVEKVTWIDDAGTRHNWTP